jgi:hypothetical protein
MVAADAPHHSTRGQTVPLFIGVKSLAASAQRCEMAAGGVLDGAEQVEHIEPPILRISLGTLVSAQVAIVGRWAVQSGRDDHQRLVEQGGMRPGG